MLGTLLIVLAAAGSAGQSAPLSPPIPEVINQTKSLEVSYRGKTRKEYDLRVHNASRVAVTGLILAVVGSDGTCETHTLRSAGGVQFIVPGATREFDLEIPGKKPRWFDFGGEACPDPVLEMQKTIRTEKQVSSPRIILAAADFVNGSYEGYPLQAAEMDAYRLGFEAERERLSTLIDEELRSNSLDDRTKISSIVSRIQSSVKEPEPALLQSTMNRFSFLPASAITSIKQALKAGIADQRTEIRMSILTYKLEASKNVIPGVSLQQWWKVTKGQCDVLLPQSCKPPDS